MATLIIENNTASTKYAYSLVWLGNGTIDNPRFCIGNFSNKAKAKKMLNFLDWHQGRFGDYADYQEAGTRLANAASQANIKYI
jgi:hypothetical protein